MLCAEYDYDMDMAVQKEENYEDGFSKGVADVAKNFLKNGIDEETIIVCTGLTKEELEKLK